MTASLYALGVCALALAADAQTPASQPRATIPNIAAVVNSAGGQPGIVSGSWATIYGTGLSNTTRSWNSADFLNGQLPPQLDYISVRVNGQSAFVSYVSPTQLNVLIPDDPSLGTASIQASGQLLQSNIVYVNKVALQPALFAFTMRYPAAVHLDGSYLGLPGILAGVTTTPARPNEVIVLFGTGFGASNPPVPTGYLFATPEPMAQVVTASVGGVPANVAGYLVMPGVYQFNLTVPNLADGDAAITIAAAGLAIPQGSFISVAR